MKMQVVKCPSCNGQVQIDVSRDFGYCSYCGTKIVFEHDAPANATQAFANNREAALDEISRLSGHFEKISGDYEKIDSLNKSLRWMKRKNYGGFAAAGCASIVFGLIAIAGDSAAGGILLMAFGVLMFIWRRALVNKNKQNIADTEYEIGRLNAEVKVTYDSYPGCPLGIEYCRPDILYELYEYIRKGRAETIKEAVNLMAEEEHNAEMKRIALETREIARQNLDVNTVNMINNTFK